MKTRLGFLNDWRLCVIAIAVTSLVFYTVIVFFSSFHRLQLTSGHIVDNSKRLSYRASLLTPEDDIIAWWLEETRQNSLLQNTSTPEAVTLPIRTRTSAATFKKRDRHLKNVMLAQAIRYFFAPKLSIKDRENLLATMKLCLELVENAGLSYFIYGGTLIGYHRHNRSLVPWDDDVDIALLTTFDYEFKNYAHKLMKAIKAYPSHDMVYVEHQHRLKCFGRLENNSYIITNPLRKWRWPFVDLQFMHTEGGFVNGLQKDTERFTKMIQDMSSSNFEYPYEMIYPLEKTTFSEANISVNVPHDVASVLSSNYELSLCKSQSDYNHRIEHPAEHSVTVECSQLSTFIDFTNLPKDDL